ncbi:MAG TPA: signal recognition particle protein [Candidatus Sumerlaeota bacterium]|nr:signal recognition particle protein [Candidatus Sumerlaeota bacterium]
MFDNLGEKFERIFKKLKGESTISEKNIRDAMHEVKLALLEADVNFKVVKDFIQKVTEKAVGQEVLTSISPGQQIIKFVYDALVDVMGGKPKEFELHQSKINKVMLLGLQGSGKTTFAGKLAKYCLKKGWKPLLVACDVYRPAAINQLKVVGEQAGVPVFEKGQIKPLDIAREAIDFALHEGCNIMIVDTAGRLHINEVLMDELIGLKAFLKPEYAFLVADAMTGQDAVKSASAFDSQVGIDAVCLTKLDGDARGGAALSIRAVTGKPIVFSSIGEKLTDLEMFYPDRMASRILGMGDVVTLVEKAQETFDAKQAQEMQKKLMRQSFTFQDFLDQMKQVKRMGPLKDIMSMIPGVGRQLKDVDFDEAELGRVEAVILSMTPEEREHPEILTGSRRQRIAKGSGATLQDVNALIRQFEEAKKMMQRMMGATGLMGKLNPFSKKRKEEAKADHKFEKQQKKQQLKKKKKKRK